MHVPSIQFCLMFYKKKKNPIFIVILYRWPNQLLGPMQAADPMQFVNYNGEKKNSEYNLGLKIKV